MIPAKMVVELLGVSDPEAEAIVAEMAKAGKVESLSPAEFATRAVASANRLAMAKLYGMAEPPPVPLPDRAESLAKLLDHLVTLPPGSARIRGLASKAARDSESISAEAGPDMVLIFGGRALVPDPDQGYRSWRYRDLDMERFESAERTAVEAAAAAMRGERLRASEVAELVNAVRTTTDATEAEAFRLAVEFGRLVGVDPPEGLPDLGRISTSLLESLRSHGCTEAGRSTDDEESPRAAVAARGERESLASAWGDEDARIELLPFDFVRKIRLTLETAEIEPCSTLSSFNPAEAEAVSRLALLSLRTILLRMSLAS